MWILITITSTVVVLFLIGRNSIKSSISKNITLNGGMLVVYNVLVDGLLEDSDTRILGVGDNSMNIGMTNRDGSTTFKIVQLYDNVIITWNVSSQIFGNHTLRWEFPNGTDQNKMLSTITAHIKSYNQANILKLSNSFTEFIHESLPKKNRIENIAIFDIESEFETSNAKKQYFDKMNDLSPSEKDLEQLFNHLSKNIISEAKSNQISPKDTQSGILYEWTKGYAEYKGITTTAFDINIISELYDSNPSLLIELIEAKKKGDNIKFEKLLSEHPEHFDLLISNMSKHAKKTNTIDEEYPF